MLLAGIQTSATAGFPCGLIPGKKHAGMTLGAFSDKLLDRLSMGSRYSWSRRAAVLPLVGIPLFPCHKTPSEEIDHGDRPVKKEDIA
jgi:hypothetical protein